MFRFLGLRLAGRGQQVQLGEDVECQAIGSWSWFFLGWFEDFLRRPFGQVCTANHSHDFISRALCERLKELSSTISFRMVVVDGRDGPANMTTYWSLFERRGTIGPTCRRRTGD